MQADQKSYRLLQYLNTEDVPDSRNFRKTAKSLISKRIEMLPVIHVFIENQLSRPRPGLYTNNRH